MNAASCFLNGAEIPDGGSIDVFFLETVAVGQNCQSESRTCDNGILSGSATFPVCTSGTQCNPGSTQPCAINNGTGRQTCVNGLWDVCKAISCNCGYKLTNSNSCSKNGAPSWDGINGPQHQATYIWDCKCNRNAHSYPWEYQGYFPDYKLHCWHKLTSCDPGYHIETQSNGQIQCIAD